MAGRLAVALVLLMMSGCQRKEAEVATDWAALPVVRDLANLGDARRGLQDAISKRRDEIFACFKGSVAPEGVSYVGETVGLNLIGDVDEFVVADAWIVDRNAQVTSIESCVLNVFRGARFKVAGVKKGTRLRTTYPVVFNYPK